MSAWVSATLYRPGPPPVITSGSIADFLEQVFALDLRVENAPIRAHLKYGRAIDQDRKPSYIEDDPDALCTIIRPIKWNAQLETRSSEEIVQWLRSLVWRRGLLIHKIVEPVIYRAGISLGVMREEVWSQFSRDCNEATYDDGMCLGALFLSIEPELAADPRSEGPVHMVGWMSVSVGGNGYLWPWTYDEALDHIKASEPMQRLGDICRAHWPVPEIEVTEEIIKARKEMGYLWGGDDYDAPPDWRWVISESY